MSVKILRRGIINNIKEFKCSCCERIKTGEVCRVWDYFIKEDKSFHSIKLCDSCEHLIETLGDLTNNNFLSDIERMVKNCVCIYCRFYDICLTKHDPHPRCEVIDTAKNSIQE